MKLLAVFLLFSIVEKYSLVHGDGNIHLFRRTVECASGWTAVNDRCFIFVAEPKPWAEAEKHCLTLEANLASVLSQTDYEQIQTLIFTATRKNSVAWIGGSDAQQSKVWLWSDGSPMTYTNWCPGRPNALGRQDCVQMNHSKKNCWNDKKCSLKKPSVCVKKTSPPKKAEA